MFLYSRKVGKTCGVSIYSKPVEDTPVVQIVNFEVSIYALDMKNFLLVEFQTLLPSRGFGYFVHSGELTSFVVAAKRPNRIPEGH